MAACFSRGDRTGSPEAARRSRALRLVSSQLTVLIRTPCSQDQPHVPGSAYQQAEY